MRAVIVHTPGPAEVMRLATLPEPEPGAGEISIDVAYAGVGFVDTLFRQAELGRLIVVGNASGEDVALSGDTLWHGTKAVLGLSLGGIAHLMPEQVATAAMSVLERVRTGATVPSPASILPLDEAHVAHRALETRSAPAKIVLAT